jgi:4-amino-4-deoxy-L-arabinose transferase-like glycosyltransferase
VRQCSCCTWSDSSSCRKRSSPLLPSRLSRWLRQRWPDLILVGLLPVALALRVYGLDWDRGLYFHPDERQILMVVERLAVPAHWQELFTPDSSLNPRFFAYGSFPIYLLRLCAWVVALWRPAWASMSQFYRLGRLLSALFDTATVAITYVLARKLFDRRVGLLAAAFVTFTVLHIQLAHFYTVDTVLTTLALLAVNKAVDVAREGRLRHGVMLGALFGAALATKVSALPLALVVVLAWLASTWAVQPMRGPMRARLKTAWTAVRRRVVVTFAVGAVCFVLLQPYAVIDAYRFVTGVGQELAMAQGWYDFPYTRQYAGTWPYLYQARQIVLFAMGLPLGLVSLGGLLWMGLRVWRHPVPDLAVLVAWMLLYAVTQGAAYAKFIRYTLPLLPLLCLAGSAMWVTAWDGEGGAATKVNRHRGRKIILTISLVAVLLSTVFYAGAFLNVYRQPHTWVQASVWLCQHLESGSTVLTEEWDDPLPMLGAVTGGHCPSDMITILRLDVYGAGTEQDGLLTALEAADYIVLSSQRLYAPISRLSERYPISSRYYQELFAERLGFQLVEAPAVYAQLAGITLVDNPRAGLALPSPPLLAQTRPGGLVIDLGRADESFTVYDHPQPLIFAKTSALPRHQLEALLSR